MRKSGRHLFARGTGYNALYEAHQHSFTGALLYAERRGTNVNHKLNLTVI